MNKETLENRITFTKNQIIAYIKGVEVQQARLEIFQNDLRKYEKELDKLNKVKNE